MIEVLNEILFYNLADTPPIDDSVPIVIDTENAQGITVINTSIAGVVYVNGVALFPFGVGKNYISFRGNENELLTSKINVIAIKTIGNADFGFCVIRKIYKNANTKLQSRFFNSSTKPGRKK